MKNGGRCGSAGDHTPFQKCCAQIPGTQEGSGMDLLGADVEKLWYVGGAQACLPSCSSPAVQT